MTRRRPGRRSHCPIAFALDLFGDQWTLLVVRDIALLGKRTYREFLSSGEGIATSVLADRLERLERAGIVTRRPNPSDRRGQVYLLTERGIDLLPVLLEMIEWSSKHDPNSAVSPELSGELRRNRGRLAAALRARLDDSRPARARRTKGTR